MPTELCYGFERVVSNGSHSCQRREFRSPRSKDMASAGNCRQGQRGLLRNGSFLPVRETRIASGNRQWLLTGALLCKQGRRSSVAAEDGSPLFRPLKPGRQQMQMRLTPSSLPVRCRCSVPIASMRRVICATILRRGIGRVRARKPFVLVPWGCDTALLLHMAGGTLQGLMPRLCWVPPSLREDRNVVDLVSKSEKALCNCL